MSDIKALTMEGVTAFLEYSTIHGLAYISTTKTRLLKLFWILVVIGGFTGAGVMIFNSIQSWHESPVKTTIETHPITELMFPKITVCPPKNTNTDLNYDLMTKNMTLDNYTRNKLTNYAVEMLYDHLYEDIMRNMSMLEDNDRYYNWYHGYTRIEIPYYRYFKINYHVNTGASSGSISTKYFGDDFDTDKVVTSLYYGVRIYTPSIVRHNLNVTLHLEIEYVSLKDLQSTRDRLSVEDNRVKTLYSNFNYTALTSFYDIRLAREVFPADILIQKIRQMPGLRVTWRYSGMEVEPWAKYYKSTRTKAFIRKRSNNTIY